MTKNIEIPIRKMNRKSLQIKYTTIHQSLQEQTGKNISIQTVRRIGKKQLGANMKRGVKRTLTESK